MGNEIMKRLIPTLTVLGLSIAIVSPASAACNFASSGTESNGGTNGTSVLLTYTQTLSLGTFVRPNAVTGAAMLTVAPSGARSIPASLNIPRDTLTVAMAPRAAVAQIAGGRNCGFSIAATATTGDLSFVKFEAKSPFTFLTSGSGSATGRLDSLGRFEFTVGVSQSVNPAPSSQSTGGSITISVTYTNVSP
jgi:hypothetical protein